MNQERRQPGPRRGGSRGRFVFDSSLQVGSGSEELLDALVGAYRQAGLSVLGELWEADVERLCGERWKPRPQSTVTRAGWCGCQITLGGQRVSLRRPRVRSVRGKEIELPSFKEASSRDLLNRDAVEDVTTSLTTGIYPTGRRQRDAIAESFVSMLASRMAALQAVPRKEFEPGLLVATVDFPDQSFLGAVGIEADGRRCLVAVRAGDTCNPASVDAFLEDVVAKHRRSLPPRVFFVGEDSVIREAIRRQFGSGAVLRRSPHEKRRRVLGILPPSSQARVLEKMIEAWRQ